MAGTSQTCLKVCSLLQNNATVYVICCLNTSHNPEKQDWKGYVLTPSYLLLLGQGKQSLPFLISQQNAAFLTACFGKPKWLIRLPAGRAQPWAAVILDGPLQHSHSVLPALCWALSISIHSSQRQFQRQETRRFPCLRAPALLWKRFLSVRGCCVAINSSSLVSSYNLKLALKGHDCLICLNSPLAI